MAIKGEIDLGVCGGGVYGHLATVKGRINLRYREKSGSTLKGDVGFVGSSVTVAHTH